MREEERERERESKRERGTKERMKRTFLGTSKILTLLQQRWLLSVEGCLVPVHLHRQQQQQDQHDFLMPPSIRHFWRLSCWIYSIRGIFRPDWVRREGGFSTGLFLFELQLPKAEELKFLELSEVSSSKINKWWSSSKHVMSQNMLAFCWLMDGHSCYLYWFDKPITAANGFI